ncbi:MAG: hypothetical protein A2Z02_00905 [Chloroflexi bacterium RBG_16_48_7]|nr:MAG: hypothetical protein A2Z02_00905 [Chloroflexi bacterium RBG_16_48_7]
MLDEYIIFKFLSLVIVWFIPALLILATFAFMISIPVFSLGGLLFKIHDAFWVRLKGNIQATSRRIKATCSVDTDCPEGFVCLSGYCVPEDQLSIGKR